MMTRLMPLAAAALALSACATNAPTTTKTSTPAANDDRPVVALVLGGGGARGFAHVGVIESLEAHGIRPDLIVGTSAGAMVGSLYASGMSPQHLHDIATTLNERDLINITPSKQGFIDGSRLRDYINARVNRRPIEQFPIRFAAVATEMHSKQAVAFRQGEAGLAVQASSSVPNLFIPPRIPENGGHKYIDGSQSALLPARIARSLGADVVISVDLMAKPVTADEADSQANTTTAKPNTVGITRDDTGVGIKWGEQSVNIPIDIAKMNEVSKGLPFELPLGDIFGNMIKTLPAKQEIELPKELPTRLPSNASEFWQLFGQVGANLKANPADIAASDVVIAPDLSKVAVFDTTGRTALIQAGKTATDAQIDAIKQAIATAQYHYVDNTQ
ncbi:patatin-like phospholipase family protein [Moraxella sp. FZLJ2107]|uniref:patatin-like phospholipase family protein n=1 Tax=unclassified Moraxella TaxID=2685852 RepID=UPI0020C86B17|nr:MULTISPECIES: patatin-like phospholipase family protein [unclassified Moraxella]UTO04529.1 patatin-like phospholipase family protein [Moraxella sp. FZLJ2107]UTO23362.1 patatin-like phospholipase family protein [Moraxella sp. FZLJ2109]